MDFTLDDVRFLQSAAGERLLERLRTDDLSDANALRLMTVLRKDYGAREAAVAVEMARLRLQAAEKFGADAARLLFTRAALEQASDPLIRRWRADLTSDYARVYDACCGIGSDSLAFAGAYPLREGGVLGLDIDPVRVKMARHNAAQLGYPARFEVSDVTTEPRLLMVGERDMIFFDPGRRDADGGRIFDVERYQPPVSTLLKWSNPGLIAVKLSPGVKLDQLRNYWWGYVTFCSVSGDLKEAVLWLEHGFSGGEDLWCKAVLFDQGRVYTWTNHEAIDYPNLPPSAARAYVCEPDPALIRAGFVRSIAAKYGGALLDDTIAYFTCETLPTHPYLRSWAKAWRVQAWMPFNVKRLRDYCRAHGIGGVTVKKRGTAVTPEVIIPQLKLRGDQRATLILTRDRGMPAAIICDEMPVN